MKTIKAVLMSCVFFAFVTLVLAEDLEQPPAPGKPKNFILPARKTFTLDNKMKVTLVEYGTLPKVTVSLFIRAGNIDEAADQVWLADMVGDLMKEGTTHRSAADIATEAASMGGEVNIGVGPDRTTIGGDVLSEFGADLAKLIADIAQNPLFPESELDRLKKDRLRTLSIQKSQPRSMALAKFRSVLYSDHPYGRLFPSEEMIKGYTVEDIKAFYHKNFSAARSHLFVSGRFDAGKMESNIRKAFKDWAEGSPPEVKPPHPESKRAIYIIDRPGAAQSTVYLGLPVVDPTHEDYVPLLVTNSLLGGSFTSRITKNIREEKGYTYSPFSQISTRFRDAYWVEVADVTTEVTGPALREIFYEINRLQDEPPSQEETEGIENFMAGTFVLRNSTRGGIINQLAFLDLHGLDVSYLTEYVQHVHAVSAEKIQEMAQKYLNDDEMTIVIAGDKKKILKQVKNYGKIVN